MTATRPERRAGGRTSLLYLLPAFLFFGAFGLWPLGQAVVLSFQNWNGVSAPTAAGFSNYVQAVTNPEIRSALVHSFVFIVFYSAVPITIGLLLAGLIARIRIRGLTWFRALLFIPQVLPAVVVAVAWRWIYATDGPLNQSLDAIGLSAVSRAWLGDFTWALPAVGLVGSWVTFGLVFVLFVSGLQKIPTTLYEAARIDGAGWWPEFRAVTMPGLRGEITVALVITITAALRNFDLVFVTTGGGPGTSTTVPSVFIYRAVFQTREIGLGAAIGLVLMILISFINYGIVTYRRRQDPIA